MVIGFSPVAAHAESSASAASGAADRTARPAQLALRPSVLLPGIPAPAAPALPPAASTSVHPASHVPAKLRMRPNRGIVPRSIDLDQSTAIDRKGNTGDKARLVGRQEQGRIGDVP